MKLRWKINRKNFGTNKHVAKLIRDDDSFSSADILKVYETPGVDYYTKVCKDFSSIVEPFVIFHADISEYVDLPINKESKDYRNVDITSAMQDIEYKSKCLDYACKQIETDFNEQAGKILRLIS